MKLTQTVQKGGCAAKVAAHELRRILDDVRFPTPQPKLKINGADFDDAAIYEFSSGPDGQSLVKTLDFFTPIVDTPYIFGQVAAANAMSDVYAMGGAPIMALAILAFPLKDFDKKVVVDILQGAIDKLAEAKADLAGGHSIDDDTLKFGLSVTGLVDNNHIWTNKNARDGDVLILTKGLGTGTLMASLKNGFKTEDELNDALTSMRQLNNILPLLSQDQHSAIHAATDVTGFGLAGHAYQMARASNATFTIHRESLQPLEHALTTLKEGFLTKAHRTNREYTQAHITISDRLSKEDQLLFFDPQTSGGLLLSVAPNYAQAIYEALKPAFTKTAIIGNVGHFQNSYVLYDL
jgi:selenide,water dikinase